MCIHVHTHICINAYIYKYNLPNLFNVTYDFKTDHLILDNQLGGSSLEKITPPISSIPKLLVVLYLQLGPHEISYLQVSVSAVVPIRVFFKAAMLLRYYEGSIFIIPYEDT